MQSFSQGIVENVKDFLLPFDIVCHWSDCSDVILMPCQSNNLSFPCNPTGVVVGLSKTHSKRKHAPIFFCFFFFFKTP